LTRNEDQISRIADKFGRKMKPRLASHRTDRYTGKLGKTAAGPIVVDGRDGYLWVRMGPEANPSQVWNPNRIRPIQDLDVLMGWSHSRPGEMQILDVNYGARGGGDGWRNGDGDYQNYGERHWTDKRDIVPFLLHAAGGLNVRAHPDFYLDDTEDVEFFIGETVSLSAYVPGTGSLFVHVYLDAATGALSVVEGDVLSALGPGGYPSSEVADEMIPNPPEGGYPLGAVLLTAAQTTIGAADIYDTRMIWNKIGGSMGLIDRMLTDDNGNILVDDNGNVLIGD
jgi:hypothetical protein